MGTLNSIIAVARNRGVDIICNEVSNRATPSMVTFGQNCRFLGEAAKSQEISNFRSSISCLKRLLGLKLGEDDAQFEIERQFLNCPAELTEEGVFLTVYYLGEQRRFSAVQVMAMFFGNLKEIAQAEVKVAVTDLVLAVPPYYGERQRRALFDAAQVADLNVTRMVSEPLAVALGYGMPKIELDAERLVCFVDVGYASTTVSVVNFVKGKAEVKAVSFDENLGGRDFDLLLARSFLGELATKGMVVSENPKAFFRLRAGCERTKKVLSANQVAVLNVENLANDRDFSCNVTRQTFEEMISPLIYRLEAVILKAFIAVEISSIHSVEIIGGSSRIPAIKDLLKRIFGSECCTTLNQDEAIARGCALQSALLSPTFKVREYSISDYNLFDRVFSWVPLCEGDGEAKAFPVGNTIPSTKLLSFDPRPLPFEIGASVISHSGKTIAIGRAVVEGSAPEGAVIKVKVRLNPNNLVSFEGVSLAEGEAPLKISFTSFLNLDKKVIESLREQEASMAAADKLVADTADRKNALEAYIYEMRNNLSADSGSLYRFAEPASREKLLELCTSTEDWLYSEEGEEASKSMYVQKLSQLEKLGEPIVKRAVDFENRPEAETLLRNTISEYQKMIQSPLYDHIPMDELQKATNICGDALKWLETQLTAQSQFPLYQDPVLTCSTLKAEREKLIAKCVRILSKPRPKPAPTPSTTPSEATQSDQQNECCQEEECCQAGGCCQEQEGRCQSGSCCQEEREEFECCRGQGCCNMEQ